MTLEELIAEARQIVANRRAQEDDERQRRQQQYDAKFNQIMADAVGRINQSLPDPLRPFVAYAGVPVDIGTLRTYPDGWTPCDFKIASAPGLAEIKFTTTTGTRPDVLRVSEIHIETSVGVVQYGTDWATAISDAADAATRS
jgi:hypothetical protein